MESAITMGIGGSAFLIAGALVFGVAARFVGETQTGYEWLVDAIAFGIGAIVACEFTVAWQTVEPMRDGLAIVPALTGSPPLGRAVGRSAAGPSRQSAQLTGAWLALERSVG